MKNYSGEAIVDKTGRFSFNDLINQIEDYSNIVQNEIEVGDVLVIESDYSFYSVALLIALSRFPCIIVPVVKTTENEFNSKLKSSEANKLVRFANNFSISFTKICNEKSTYEKYKIITENGSSGIVLFTSGTTGTPKSMVHNFSTFIDSFKPPKRQKRLKFLLFLMFDHIGGLNTLLNCLNNGSPIVIPEKRNPSDILNLIEIEKIQVLPTSPTFLNLMLQVDDFEQRKLKSLKLITYGTEKMPMVLLEKLNKVIPNVRYIQTFGTSETGIMKTQSKSSTSLYFKIVDPDIEYRIENDQLFIKSKTSVAEYKGQKSNKFSNDGWFATGDLVDVDNEGYIKIMGRINDIINVGGLKVMPSEVEDVLNGVQGVIDSTVYAKSNAIVGQVVCAKIVTNNQFADKELKKELKRVCLEKLDKFKIPVKFTFTQEIKATNRFKKSNKDL